MRDTININYIIGILKISCVMVAGLACFWLFWCHHNHMCVCVCFVCTQMHSCISLTPITKFKTNIYTRILHILTHIQYSERFRTWKTALSLWLLNASTYIYVFVYMCSTQICRIRAAQSYEKSEALKWIMECFWILIIGRVPNKL